MNVRKTKNKRITEQVPKVNDDSVLYKKKLGAKYLKYSIYRVATWHYKFDNTRLSTIL